MEIKELLIALKKIFYRCFLIGLLFLALAALIYLPCKCYVANIYQTHFGVAVSTYYNLWVGFIGLIKTIIVFLFLVPALAIHLTCFEYKAVKKD